MLDADIKRIYLCLILFSNLKRKLPVMPAPWKRAWGRPPRPAADKDIHIACSKCAVTFIHTVAEQVAFKNKNFKPPRKCALCVQYTKEAKNVLYKGQLAAKKLANKKKKQVTKALTSG